MDEFAILRDLIDRGMSKEHADKIIADLRDHIRSHPASNLETFKRWAFDGRYVYLGPVSGIITRYDITRSFTDAGGYTAFDITDINAHISMGVIAELREDIAKIKELVTKESWLTEVKVTGRIMIGMLIVTLVYSILKFTYL